MRAISAALMIFVLTLIFVFSGPSLATTQGPADIGRQIFRFNTFGDEQLWTDFLFMHEPISNLTPANALAVGLKVDSEALPQTVIDVLPSLINNPAATRELIRLNAVVGIVGTVTPGGELTRVGITCALCHSTVDNSLTTGIGRRLDGWPNRDLHVGGILSLSKTLAAFASEFSRWPRGTYDPRHHVFDGTTLHVIHTPSVPVVIPPAYGLQKVPFETFTAEGPISYWNAYVGITQMGGQASFSDPRLPVLPPIIQSPDLVTSKLAALLDYQLRLRAPEPPQGSFNQGAANRGEKLFHGQADCARCHKPPAYTDVSDGPDANTPLLHSPAEVGTEAVYDEKRHVATPTSGVPDLAAARSLAAPAVFPRRERSRFHGGRQSLQHEVRAEPE